MAQGIIIFMLVIVAYIFPAFVAEIRKHKNKNAIFVLNMFTGWTGIGWIGSLIWAATDNVNK